MRRRGAFESKDSQSSELGRRRNHELLLVGAIETPRGALLPSNDEELAIDRDALLDHDLVPELGAERYARVLASHRKVRVAHVVGRHWSVGKHTAVLVHADEALVVDAVDGDTCAIGIHGLWCCVEIRMLYMWLSVS